MWCTLKEAVGSQITKSASKPSLSCPFWLARPQRSDVLWLRKRDTSDIGNPLFLASVQNKDRPVQTRNKSTEIKTSFIVKYNSATLHTILQLKD